MKSNPSGIRNEHQFAPKANYIGFDEEQMEYWVAQGCKTVQKEKKSH